MDWFRMYHEARTDEKLVSLSDKQFRTWFRLICFAAAQKPRGVIPPMTERQLAAAVADKSVNLLRETLGELGEGSLNIVRVDADGTVTFINWEKRQFDSDASAARTRKYRDNLRRPSDSDVTSQARHSDGVTSVPSLSTEEVTESRELPEEAEDYLARELCERLAAKIKANNPKAREPNLSVWAKDMDKLLRIDRRTAEDVRAVIDWCQQDSFWCGNILSPAKLRKQFDALTMQMQRKRGEPTGLDAVRAHRAKRGQRP